MQQKIVRRCLFCLIVVFMLFEASCVSTSAPTVLTITTSWLSTTPVSRPTIKPASTTKPTIEDLIPKFSPSPENTQSKTAELFLPGIVLSVGVYPYECTREQTNQIWLSMLPHEIALPILADPQIDYNYPQWSPDGEWIAYIESIPSTIWIGNETTVITGTESIWIMRPDGTDQRRLSEFLPSTLSRWGDGCEFTSRIDAPLIWSPDGEYIAFMHTQWNDDVQNVYYVTEVSTGITKQLFVQRKKEMPVWMSDSHQVVVVGDENEIKVVNLNHMRNIETVSIIPPSEAPETGRFVLSQNRYFTSSEDENTIYGSFHAQGSLKTSIPTILSWWRINVDTRQWIMLNTIQRPAWGSSFLWKEWGIFCGNNEFFLLDRVTGEENTNIPLPKGLFVDCGLFNIFQDDVGKDFASYYGYNLVEHIVKENGIWVMQLHKENTEPALVFRLSQVPFPHILYYSLKP